MEESMPLAEADRYAELSLVLQNVLSAIPGIINVLKKVKSDLDVAIDVGVGDIRLYETYSHIVRIGEIETPKNIHQFVDDLINTNEITRLQEEWIVQALHPVLFEFESMSKLVSLAINSLLRIATYRLRIVVTYEGAIRQDRIARGIRTDLLDSNITFVSKVITNMEKLGRAHLEDLGNNRMSMRAMYRFMKGSEDDKAELMNHYWVSCTGGEDLNREDGVQARMAQVLLAMIRWPWIEALEVPERDLKGAGVHINELITRLEKCGEDGANAGPEASSNPSVEEHSEHEDESVGADYSSVTMSPTHSNSTILSE